MPLKNARPFLIGIDEAGRGPLAGPVSVGAVLLPRSFAIAKIAGVRDSKQCSEAEREAWYREALRLREAGEIRFASVLVGPQIIDARGITHAIRFGIRALLNRLEADPGQCEVRLDGLLRAPHVFTNQRTIIRGDQTEPAISFASIIAKVRRDRFMKNIASRYPLYGFEQHKGYGTDLHYQRLREHGPCEIHRRTYLRSFLQDQSVV
jgi:ribonuclease HII